MFLERFRNYTNVELLKVVLRPDQYQPEAVSAARELLAGREVSDDEKAEAEAHYRLLDAIEATKRDKWDRWEGGIRDFFDPIQFPKETLDVRRWVNIMTFVVALLYGRSVFSKIRSCFFWFNDPMRSFDPWILTVFLGIIFDLVMLVFVFRKSRWGWMLLFADLFISFLYKVAGIYPFILYYDKHFSDPVKFIGSLLINLGILVFLARQNVMDQFGVTRKMAQRTALFAVSLIFCWNILQSMLSRYIL